MFKISPQTRQNRKRFSHWLSAIFIAKPSLRGLVIFVFTGLFLGLILHNIFLTIPAYSTVISPLPPSKSSLIAAEEKPEDEKEKSFENAIKDTEKIPGLFTLYHNKETDEILAEISPKQLETNFLCTVTLESGIGERGLYSGIPLNDYLFYFRKVNKTLQFVVRNVNFRSQPNDPQERSLQRSFSDSVLFSLKIKSIHPDKETFLVDFNELLVGDLAGFSSLFKYFFESPYALDKSKSYFGKIQSFPLNVEIESISTFISGDSSEGATYLPTLADNRAFTVKTHYSFSQIEENSSYRPRLADDRIGYFITVYKDISSKNPQETFVRYLNRWQLEKQDPNSPLSPPKKPITFWLDNAIPLEYRNAVREGVLMWNKALEKAGFINAIEVQQMPDDADWNPADIRYNTIRWMNSLDGAFALGPSRVNPLTGQILDADIVIDANFINIIKQEFSNLIQQPADGQSLFSKIGENSDYCNYAHYLTKNKAKPNQFYNALVKHDLCFGLQAADQFAMGINSMSIMQNIPYNSPQIKDYVNQFLRAVVAHEIGHTLGLRHNFHGSTFLLPQQLNQKEITQKNGLVASVMDYVPVNLAPIGEKQGEYFSSTIGAYDEWAILYGYQPVPGNNPQEEKRYLESITQRSAQPELAYATDEDIWFDDINPYAQAFDLSGDVVQYAQLQMDNARAMWRRMEKRYPPKGESFSELRSLFNGVFDYYFKQVMAVTQYVGGQSFSRNHAHDFQQRPPFVPVPAAKQRQALATLQTYVFNDGIFEFSPELLNNLAPSRWVHWGNPTPTRLDYPIYEQISMLQKFVLHILMSPKRLARLRDAELRSPNQPVLSLPEVFDSLQAGIWTEITSRVPVSISSLRRSLQREYVDILSEMVLKKMPVPEDARTLARFKLRQLRDNLNLAMNQGGNFNTYTQAHLEETRDLITKVLDAQLGTKNLAKPS